jgi:DNA-binding transcriptional ArsR family regulator
MDVKRFNQAAGEASDFLKSLANPTRLRVLCALATRECSVTMLAAAAGASMSTVSRHLALLRRERAVTSRRDNQTIFYALANPNVRKIIATMTEAFCPAERQAQAPGDLSPKPKEK